MIGDRFPRCIQAAPTISTPGLLSGIYIQAEDNTKLALDVLLPQATPEAKFPTVLITTRYWRGTVGGKLSRYQTFYSEHGFAVVVGDVRGTGASFGQWPYHRSRAETRDFTSLMDWIVSRPWSDGRIIGTGGSYSGNTADWMAERNHPALKAIIPRFADYDPYADLYFPGGVPNTFMGKTWGLRVKDLDQNIRRDATGKISPGVRPVDGSHGTKMLRNAIAEHAPIPSVWEGIQQIEYRDDRPESWHGASMSDFGICSHADQIEASHMPIQNWAGWMDTGTASGAIHRFLTLDNPLHVIIGPWSHAGSHNFDPLQPQKDDIAPIYSAQQAEDLLFIQESFAGDWKDKTKRLTYFTCGEGRWKTTTVWPPANTHYEEWYISSNNTLTRTHAGTGIDAYKVDFDVGTGKTSRWATGQDGGPVLYDDRSEIDKRLLCYTSAPLEEDAEITGHPILTIYLSSTESDGAIFGYLELVALNGTVIYLTEGQLRVIHRKISDDRPIYPHVEPYHSFLRKDAMPLVPGEIAEISFGLNPISVRVPAGHRLRLAIAGADADVFARVPPTGNPTIQIHRNLQLQSRIMLPFAR